MRLAGAMSEEDASETPPGADSRFARRSAQAAGGPSGAQAPPAVLLIVDSPRDASLFADLLCDAFGPDARLRHRTTLAASREDLVSGEIDCVLLDLSLGDSPGLESLAKLIEVAPDLPVVVLNGDDGDALAVQAVHEGAQDYLGKAGVDGELLCRAIRYAIQRKEGELQLARHAYYDLLTGLPNRRLLLDRLTLALAAAERSGALVAVLFLDLDRFKVVNDSLGHDAGDALLREIAERLPALVRPSDTVARFGGDEFMVLCPDLDHEREAVVLAERLSGGLEEPMQVDGHQLWVGASMGIAFGRHGSITPEALLRDADQTMYRAKERSSRYELFEDGAGARARARLSVETELRHALDRGELRLYYQPELDLHRNRVCSVEVLLRWCHPEKGMIPPSDFIPAAEDSNLIVPIGEWVVAESVRQLAEWRRTGIGGPDLTMSVNLAPRQLADDRLPEVVRSTLEREGVPPEALCLELTESFVAADPDRMLRRLEELREIGLSLSLDDFGTGMSSLGALSAYPLDMVKVDRSFVSRLTGEDKARRLFASVIGVAHALELRAVAEGVETREQLEIIAGAGCDVAQGFFVCRPGPADTLGPALAGALGHAFV